MPFRKPPGPTPPPNAHGGVDIVTGPRNEFRGREVIHEFTACISDSPPDGWEPPRRLLKERARINPGRLVGDSDREVPEGELPKTLFRKFKKVIGKLDIKLEPKYHPIIAAALVHHVYTWNGFCEWRETRNLVADILSQLRPQNARRMQADGASRALLLQDLQRLSLIRLYKNPYIESEIAAFSAKITNSGDAFIDECRVFAKWLQGQSDYRIGSGATIFVDIPGSFGVNIGGKRHLQENEAAQQISILLPMLLRMIYQTDRDAVSDAHLILRRTFAGAPHAVPDFEVFRAARWRKSGNLAAVDSELGRYTIWFTLAEAAQTFEQPSFDQSVAASADRLRQSTGTRASLAGRDEASSGNPQRLLPSGSASTSKEGDGEHFGPGSRMGERGGSG